jgi:N-alpha-acetyl-L-2,4-diaminobutyrate deacetylase
LQDLVITLGHESIIGRVIIIPAFNNPAFRSDIRASPIDKDKMNCYFPNRLDGSVTEEITDFFQIPYLHSIIAFDEAFFVKRITFDQRI